VRARLKTARTASTAAVGAVALNYPILGLADTNTMVMGVPALYLYLFGVWALIIALVALAIRLSR
jgi:hypothetical protein